MTPSKFALMWVFLPLICMSIRADVSIEDGGKVVGSDRSDSFALKIEPDKSKIHELESHIEGKSQESKTKDDLIAQKEKVIQEKSDSIASLQSEISSLQKKGKIDAVEQVGKAHAHVNELHKQVDELEKELKTQEKEKDVLNARASEAEKKVKELNSKLENRYIMKSYFEKYESLDDTNFQEFISHGLPIDLCELLQSNPDLLRLSIPQRLLIGEGSHRHLSSSIKFRNEPESASQLPSHFCEVLIIERLPSGVFADPFELQHLLDRGAFTNVAVFGDTNLELPSVLSNQSAIEVHMNLGSNMLSRHKKELDVNIRLPIHARYPPLDESGYSTVEFGTPDIFLYCSIEGKSGNRKCLLIPTIDGANTNAEPVFWRIPSGRTAHARIVFFLTYISAFISTLLIVLSSMYHSNSGNSKMAKLS